MPENKPDRRSRIRFPITLYVDGVEFSPTIDFEQETVRTAYDLELAENDMRKLHEWLGNKISKGQFISARIRFIGRLVSQ
jgi:hypothetical protein